MGVSELGDGEERGVNYYDLKDSYKFYGRIKIKLTTSLFTIISLCPKNRKIKNYS